MPNSGDLYYLCPLPYGLHTCGPYTSLDGPGRDLRPAGYLGGPGAFWGRRELWEAGKPPVKHAAVEMAIQGTEVIIAPQNWPGAALGVGVAQTPSYRAED